MGCVHDRISMDKICLKHCNVSTEHRSIVTVVVYKDKTKVFKYDFRRQLRCDLQSLRDLQEVINYQFTRVNGPNASTSILGIDLFSPLPLIAQRWQQHERSQQTPGETSFFRASLERQQISSNEIPASIHNITKEPSKVTIVFRKFPASKSSLSGDMLARSDKALSLEQDQTSDSFGDDEQNSVWSTDNSSFEGIGFWGFSTPSNTNLNYEKNLFQL